MTAIITTSQALRCVVLQRQSSSPTCAKQPEEVERENLGLDATRALGVRLLLLRHANSMQPTQGLRSPVVVTEIIPRRS